VRQRPQTIGRDENRQAAAREQILRGREILGRIIGQPKSAQRRAKDWDERDEGNQDRRGPPEEIGSPSSGGNQATFVGGACLGRA
jgi:hypothetical protein